jgi:hypothetical protein
MLKFNLLTDTEKQKALEKVDRVFDKTFYYKSRFEHKIFLEKFPYEYHNTPIGNLTGEAKKLNDYLFEQSQRWIKPIYDLLCEHTAVKVLSRRKSISHISFRKFVKTYNA